jgi:hypothetical protein
MKKESDEDRYTTFKRVNKVLKNTTNWLEAEIRHTRPMMESPAVYLDDKEGGEERLKGRLQVALGLALLIQEWKSEE